MSTVMTRRIKQPASVDPARLATALHEKLGAAYWKLSELRQSEQPRLTPNLEPQTIIPHFLTSARGVHSTANTFASSSWRQGEFGIWRKQWEATLSLDELGDGADLMPIQIPIPPQEGLSRDSTLLLAGLPAHRSESFKGGVRFKSYPDKLASEVCFAYWELCRRFVDDFLRDNAARSEPPPTA